MVSSECLDPCVKLAAHRCSDAMGGGSIVPEIVEEDRPRLVRRVVELAPKAQTGTRRVFFPLRLTVQEFAILTRQCDESVRRLIRRGVILARGRPALIPRRELERWDVSLADAAVAYGQIFADKRYDEYFRRQRVRVR